MSILQRLIQQAKILGDNWFFHALYYEQCTYETNQLGITKVYIKKEAIILDIGCGGGKTIHTLSKRTPLGKIYGIDYSYQAVKIRYRRI